MRGRSILGALLLVVSVLPRAGADGTVTARTAAAAFDDICVRQAPGFRRSRTVMARHGLTRPAGRGAAHHASGRMSVTVERAGQRGGAECTLSYQAANAESAGAAIEAIARRLFEDAWGRRAITTGAGRTGTAWSVSFQGVLGEMIHLPYSGPETRGVMILRF